MESYKEPIPPCVVSLGHIYSLSMVVSHFYAICVEGYVLSLDICIYATLLTSKWSHFFDKLCKHVPHPKWLFLMNYYWCECKSSRQNEKNPQNYTLTLKYHFSEPGVKLKRQNLTQINCAAMYCLGYGGFSILLNHL